MINLIIITGVSGGGSSTFVHVFEELDYYVVEDIPYEMFADLIKLFHKFPSRFEKAAVVVPLSEAANLIDIAREDKEVKLNVIGLYCAPGELRSRYKMTRHIHPLQAKGYSLEDAINFDQKAFASLDDRIDMKVDTSGMDEAALRRFAFANIAGIAAGTMTVTFTSFGFKFGIPLDAEVVFDVRQLPNPYWVDALRPFTGLDKPVIEYLESKSECAEMISKIEDYLDYYLPALQKQSRNFVFIDIGCSGGQHRSIYIAEKLFEHYSKSYRCFVKHREIGRYSLPNGEGQ